jgi:hypothetical protein
MVSTTSDASPRAQPGVGAALLAGALVAIALGVYGKVHTAAQRPLFDLGFSSMLPMKAWLTTAAAALLVVQLTTALWMWRRLPGAGAPPSWAGGLHRWSGTTAFVLTLPVAFHCLWSLGFVTTSARTAVHGFFGCVFYGAYATKMLCLRLRGIPSWSLPVVGGTVLGSLALLWLTAALWFFTRSGIPLT